MTDHIETLRQYNLWRRGAEMDQPHPEGIGQAIDAAISEIERRRRGECICIRCGLRQDGEKTLGDF